MSRRLERINELLREELGSLILRAVRDPRVDGLISVTEVRVAPDLSNATVFVSTLGDSNTQNQALLGLNQAARFLKRELRARVALKQIPDLHFRLDTSIATGARIEAILHELALPPANEEPRR